MTGQPQYLTLIQSIIESGIIKATGLDGHVISDILRAALRFLNMQSRHGEKIWLGFPLPGLVLEISICFIMNVASIASFSPIPYKTVYPASKAFIYSFSRGLASELRGTGVRLCVVHPGPMATNADSTTRIREQIWIGRQGILPAEKIARKHGFLIPDRTAHGFPPETNLRTEGLE